VPDYRVDACTIEIARDAVLLDTNVLVALFFPRDDYHGDTEHFFETHHYQWLIPAAVVVETWGLLSARTKTFMIGQQFFAWLNTPGRRVVVLPQSEKLEKDYELLKALYLDCVDAMIANLAHEITTQCNLEKPLPIATFDADISKIKAKRSLRMAPFDLRWDEPPYGN
jgi:predicted nucleic acid-binding protein